MRRVSGVLVSVALAAGGILSLSGCELTEVSLAEPEDIVVAEVYVMLGDGEDQITAFLHWTKGSGSTPELEESTVRLVKENDSSIHFDRRLPDDCLLPTVPDQVEGVCFVVPDTVIPPRPGSTIEIEIITPRGDVLTGSTMIPEAVSILRPHGGGDCFLPPDRPLTLRWSRSEGAWAYAAEAQIWNLREAMEGLGVEVAEDTVALLGLAISDRDTTVVFPGEFGVFDRFTLDQDVALAFQEGLPEEAIAQVTIGALDRNYVNWVRGGSFNPSGTVRIPSIRGDGTGVFAAVFRRTFRIVGAPVPMAAGNCFFVPS